MFKLPNMLFEITFIVHGYLVYKDIWEVEKLSCLPEPDNHKDHHATAIL